MVEPKPRELQGWKQIAAYLDVSIPTVKRYRKELGLPVFKRGGRYFASPELIDAWRMSPEAMSAKRGEVAPAESSIPAVRKSWLRRFWPAFAAGVAAALLFALALVQGRSSRVQAVYIVPDERTFRTVDAKGRELIRFDPPDFNWEIYDEKHGRDRFLHADVDDDGRGEVIFFNCPEQLGTRTCRVECLDEDRTLLWHLPLGREWFFEREQRTIDGMYVGQWLRWVRTPESDLVLVTARHHRWFPTHVMLLEPSSGRLVSEYWHPGYIYSVAFFDTDGDGEDELLLGGTNNPFEGFGHPSLAVLDLPFGEPRDVPGNVFGRANAKEARYIIFPFLDVFESRRDGGSKVEELVVRAPNRLEAKVGQPYESWLFYELDARLEVIDVYCSDRLKIEHDQAHWEGLLDHLYDESELEGWRRVLELPTAPNGNSDEVRRLFAELEER